MKTTYKVIGETPFRGYQPGEEFEADLDPFIEQWATKDNAYLEAVTKKKGEKDG